MAIAAVAISALGLLEINRPLSLKGLPRRNTSQYGLACSRCAPPPGARQALGATPSAGAQR